MSDEPTRTLQDGSVVPDPFAITVDERGGFIGETLVAPAPENVKFIPTPVEDDSIEVDGEKFTRAELAERLRKVKEQEELIGPVAQLAQTPWFREVHEEAIRSGAIEAPVVPPPAPEDVVGYRQRMSEPDAEGVRVAMREWAESLPEHEVHAIATNHRKFNEVYDKFRAAAGGKPFTVSRSEPQPVSDALEKLRQKGILKDQATLEKGGVMTDASGDSQSSKARKIASLQKAAAGGDRHAVANLISARFFGEG